MKYDIFICYRRSESSVDAEEIYKYLKHNGFRVFKDDNAERPGNAYEYIEEIIKNCKDFIIILSKHSLDECANRNDWVRKEVETALEYRKGKRIIPILMIGFDTQTNCPESIDSILEFQGIRNVDGKNLPQKSKELSNMLYSKPILKYIRLFIWIIFILLMALFTFILYNHISIDEPSVPFYSLIEGASNETLSSNNLYTSNIVNGGIACYDGSRYFFSNDCLWSEDKSGENVIKIYDKTVYYINSIGEYLYFVAPSEGNAICRIKRDGTEFEKIYDRYCYELTYYNEWLYFSSNMGGTEYHVCRMRTDGSNLTILANCRVWYMNIYNDKIIFCNYNDGKSIYSMNVDGSDYKLLRSGECCDLCVVNDKIYFSTDMKLRKLHSIDLNGKNEETLLNSFVRFTNYYDDKLFFVNADGILCSCNLDGSNLSELNKSTSYAFITLLPDKICCCDANNNNKLVVINV